MTCAIMQPTYLPWIGYFDLIDQVNKFVFLDSVQLARRSWQVRNRILTAQGELYLTVPIQKQKSRDETFINEAVIQDCNKWKVKHLDSIRYSYQKAPFFDEVYTFLKEIYDIPFTQLSDFNIKIITEIANRMGISTRFYKSSDLINSTSFKKAELLCCICDYIDADNYLSPVGSASYIETETPGGAFTQNNIQLYYQHFIHPLYKQGGSSFVPYMCILDLLFNEGFENGLAVIKSGRKNPYYFEQYACFCSTAPLSAAS